MDRLIFVRSAAGEPIAECELAPAEAGLLPGLAEEAARRGARRLWVHCTADLGPWGFTAQEGYRRFAANPAPAGAALPVVDTAAAVDLLPRLFAGQWGHHQPDLSSADLREAIYVGLPGQEGSWIGLCRIEPERRYIDGPGFVAGARTPAAVRRLVLAGGAQLADGPVTVETWGEPAGPYLEMGFEVVEDIAGWERVLG